MTFLIYGIIFFQESSYYPQVEAISPTLPVDSRDDSPFYTMRNDLLKQIEHVDLDIAKVCIFFI